MPDKYMMASTYSIVTLALSKLGISGGTRPARQADLDLGLQTLRSLYRNLISSGALGRANPVTPHGDYTARENDRILRNIDHIGTIALPELVRERASFGHSDQYDFYDYPVCGRPRPPRDGAFVIINDANSGGTEEWLYEAYTNRWISLHDLTLQEHEELRNDAGNIIGIVEPSVAPLSYRDENGLAALLATKLADHFGAQPSPLTLRDASNWQTSLSTRFGEPEAHLHSHFLDWF
jgi:hypothetical protein